ncbi:MAG TPA: CARDB domain-containing protein [Candidatus Dormibacteraeota bacterium]|nr:CARDB domain-containing protein [Candidatus Dormibacteraeota bacterium]
MLSPKVSLLAYVILAISMSFAIDHAALIEQQLNSQILPALRSNVDANRPISMCGRSGSVLTGHRGDSNCPLNFTLSLSQKSLVQARGSNSSVQLSVTFISGVSAPVTLSAQGAPADTEILFAPASARPSFSSTMTISTNEATPLGQFNITILAAGSGVEKSIVLSLLVVLIVHDIAIVSAAIQGTAAVGNIVVINATVANYGSVSEAFELRAYANTTLVADRSVPGLASEGVYASQLMWNTSGFSPGTYRVLVAVPPVPGELNLLNNSREAGQMILTQSPGSGPSPSPAASGSAQGLNYGRQLAIVAAIAEAAIVFLLVVRSKRRASTGNASAGTRKI